MSVASTSQLIDPAEVRRWAATLRGPVLLPGHLAYDSARRVWNRAIDARPAAIARCSTVDDVRRGIEFARVRNLPLAVRSGGHSQAGHGTCDGGIVVDLSSLRAIAIDPDRHVATVAAGARVGDVLDATRARGMVTPMGGCPEVGVGGLTLGGGENFLMARYGAVCDNLLGGEVVTADGRVLATDARVHPDLFWAIRGGSGNVGIVTSFHYRLLPFTHVLSGQFFFEVARAREVMLRYRDLMADASDDLETSGGLASRSDGPAFAVDICVGGDARRAGAVAAHWRTVLRPESDTVKWAPFSADLVVPAAASAGSGIFVPELSDAVIEIIAAAVESAPASATVTWNDFHGEVTRVPREAMAFPLRDAGFDLFLSAPWTDDESRRAARRWVSELVQSLRPYGRGVYVNNLNESEGGRVVEAYGANYARLSTIKRIYDPDNVFHVNPNVPPARPSAESRDQGRSQHSR
jgi:FAD/FMN-containing dehydrogenase